MAMIETDCRRVGQVMQALREHVYVIAARHERRRAGEMPPWRTPAQAFVGQVVPGHRIPVGRPAFLAKSDAPFRRRAWRGDAVAATVARAGRRLSRKAQDSAQPSWRRGGTQCSLPGNERWL